MEYKNIRFEISKNIARLTMIRDDRRNTITEPDVVAEFIDAFNRIQTQREASVLIITGEGKAFCAGGNIKDLQVSDDSENSLQHRYTYVDGIQHITKGLYALDIPTIAAINGPAFGGGLDMTLFCDIAIASTKAKFCEQFVNLGLLPGDGGAWIMPRKIDWQAATDILLTGRTFGAEEAKKLGVVYDVVEPDQLLARADELAKQIASRPPNAVRFIKMLMRQGATQSLPDHLEHCASAQAVLQTTADHRIALKAILEKQSSPVFSGK